ncbi:MAG: SHOCT domain-containing protein [Chloroflexi bacterium]|nr:SHOCT domain-containing protein [Chloroflexota bacterium]
MMMGFGFLVLLLLGGILLVPLLGGIGLVSHKSGNFQWPEGQHQPTARQVLDERFARGEINREEYETIRAQIER